MHFFWLFLPTLLGAIVCIPVAAILVRPKTKEQWSVFTMAFVIYFISMVLLCLPFAFPLLRIGQHNWSGKLLSIFASYSVIFLAKVATPAKRFITLSQNPGSLPKSALIISILLLLAIAFSLATGGDHSPSLETVLFEATVPGIDEEDVFRAGVIGCLIAASGRANRGNRHMTIFAIVVTSILFALMHAIGFTSHHYFTFDLEAFAITGTIGALLALLAINSGSILLPVLAHNAANCLSFIFG